MRGSGGGRRGYRGREGVWGEGDPDIKVKTFYVKPIQYKGTGIFTSQNKYETNVKMPSLTTIKAMILH